MMPGFENRTQLQESYLLPLTFEVGTSYFLLSNFDLVFSYSELRPFENRTPDSVLSNIVLRIFVYSCFRTSNFKLRIFGFPFTGASRRCE
jgi:hypothetical protein